MPRHPREQSVLVRTQRGACVRYVVRTSLGTLARGRPRRARAQPPERPAVDDRSDDALEKDD